MPSPHYMHPNFWTRYEDQVIAQNAYVPFTPPVDVTDVTFNGAYPIGNNDGVDPPNLDPAHLNAGVFLGFQQQQGAQQFDPWNWRCVYGKATQGRSRKASSKRVHLKVHPVNFLGEKRPLPNPIRGNNISRANTFLIQPAGVDLTDYRQMRAYVVAATTQYNASRWIYHFHGVDRNRYRRVFVGLYPMPF